MAAPRPPYLACPRLLVRQMDIEVIPKWEERELFKTYIEDYNTGTLPHKKYYDNDAYARDRAIKEAKKCASCRPAPLSIAWNDIYFLADKGRGRRPDMLFSDELTATSCFFGLCSRGKKKTTERIAFDDEEDRRREEIMRRNAEIEDRKKEAYNQLKFTTNKVRIVGVTAAVPSSRGHLCSVP